MVRAAALHAAGREFESLSPHQNSKSKRRSAASLFLFLGIGRSLEGVPQAAAREERRGDTEVWGMRETTGMRELHFVTI